MKLIETIDLNILFILLGFLILVLLAFVIYKFRNRAKKNKKLPLNYDQNRIGESFTETKWAESASTSSATNHTPKKVTEYEITKQKFEVINSKTEEELSRNIHINYHSNVYRFYEETDSKKMFKLKVDSENPT